MSDDPRALRYLAMANTAISAWRGLFGATPTRNAVVLVLAVAEHETPGGGPAGAHNWGGVKKRALTPGEAAVLAAHGVRADDGSSALSAARAILAAGNDEILYRDNSPQGWHFAWFWRSDTEEDAARRMLQTLVGARPTVRAIIDSATPLELARTMYQTHYYEGVTHDPETNIRVYATAIERHAERIARVLPDWTTTPTPGVAKARRAPSPSAAPILLFLGVMGIGVAIAKAR